MQQLEKVIVIDFGGQYNQLIARRVRENNVYCEVHPYTISIEKIKEINPKGIIFTGGPNSVYNSDSPSIDKKIFELNIPILGICYGAQLIAYLLGGEVSPAEKREYGHTNIDVLTSSLLYLGVNEKTRVWMSHTDQITKTPKDFKNTAKSGTCPNVSIENADKKIYAVQFHPEVVHTDEGSKILSNFLYKVCGCKGDWKMSSYAKTMIKDLKVKIGDKKVLLALSGGVDSTVAAVLISKAVGKQLTCIFVDHGLLRKNESEEVEKVFTTQYDVNFIKVNARERFYKKLAGVTEPERKRKIIGEEFIRVFEEEAKKNGKVDFFAQGTIYPDVIESGIVGKAAVIKSHHNVGGLPDHVDFKEIVEPLRMLFKDEVRKVGLELNIPDYLVFRQPFPGPGLGIRIVGDVTEEKIRIVQDADKIFRDEIANAGLDRKIGQYFAALSNMRSVGVMGDERTYDYAVVLRAVNTIDFMTADVTEIPYEVLKKCMNRIINEVKGVNRVLYDITSKPPGTIELE